MRNIFLIIVFAFVYSGAMAHNPLTAKFELNATSQVGAILNIYSSQTGLHQTLVKHFEQTNFDNISSNEYKKLAVQYLKKHISIKADNKLLAIGEGGIRLGSHQTDIKFLIENYTSDVSELEIHINAFNENENHHSVFWWKRTGEKFKVILSEKNDFRAAFNAEGLTTLNASISSKNNYWIGLSLSALIFILFVFYKKNKHHSALKLNLNI